MTGLIVVPVSLDSFGSTDSEEKDSEIATVSFESFAVEESEAVPVTVDTIGKDGGPEIVLLSKPAVEPDSVDSFAEEGLGSSGLPVLRRRRVVGSSLSREPDMGNSMLPPDLKLAATAVSTLSLLLNGGRASCATGKHVGCSKLAALMGFFSEVRRERIYSQIDLIIEKLSTIGGVLSYFLLKYLL